MFPPQSMGNIQMKQPQQSMGEMCHNDTIKGASGAGQYEMQNKAAGMASGPQQQQMMLKYSQYFQSNNNNGEHGGNGMGQLPFTPQYSQLNPIEHGGHGDLANQPAQLHMKKNGKRATGLPSKMPQAPPEGFYCYYPKFFEK